MKRLLDINEASKLLGISPKTLYNWVSQKKIPYFKVGNMIRFDLRALEIFIEEHSIPAHEAWSSER